MLVTIKYSIFKLVCWNLRVHFLGSPLKLYTAFLAQDPLRIKPCIFRVVG